MSIQKQKLEGVANQLYTSIVGLNQVHKNKRQFAHRINNRIAQLFALISDYPTISARQLLAIFDEAQIKLLIHNKKYLTAKDICAYLGISDKHATTAPTPTPKCRHIEVDTRYELQDIMASEIRHMDNIRNALKSLPLDILFYQIDFFNNGYVDAASFAQFVKHHAKPSHSPINQTSAETNISKTNMDQLMQLKFMDVIRYLKGSATAQKIFYADFPVILQQTICTQNNPEQYQNPNSYSHALSRQIGHIAKVSDIELLHSRSRRARHDVSQNEKRNIHQSNMNNISQSRILKYDTEQTEGIEQLHGKLSHQDIEQINRIMAQHQQEVSYQQKICSNHWRNAKYLQKLKLSMNVTNLKSQLHPNIKPTQSSIPNKMSNNNVHIKKSNQKFYNSFSPLQNNQLIQNVNGSQIVYQLRYLAQIYQKFKKEAQQMINANKYFSIINAFNAIDVKDKGYVTYQELRQFLYQTQIIIHQSKIQSFFAALATPLDQTTQYSQDQLDQQRKFFDVIYYHRFATKIFKLKSIQNVYDNCRKRKPLISQQWPEQQKNNYCKFIRSIVSIIHEITKGKENLMKMLKINKIAQLNSHELEDILKALSNKMQLVFRQTDVHKDKMRQIIGKNSQILIAQLYRNQVVLEPHTFFTFLSQIV